MVEIAFENATCDIQLMNVLLISHYVNEKQMKMKMKMKMKIEEDDPYVDIEFDEIDTHSMKNDIKAISDEGDFDKLTQKLLLIRYFDDFHNLFQNLLLKNLVIKDGDGTGSIHKEIELCMKGLPACSKYERLLDGPCIVYAQQLIDCVLNKIKPGKTWTLSFIGLYPATCMMDYDGNQLDQTINNDKAMHPDCVTIKPIIDHNQNDDKKENENKMEVDNVNDEKEEEYLLYWFALRPAIIVPVEVAKKIFDECVGQIAHKFKKNDTDEMNLATLDDDQRSSHSSWMVDQTYSYHNMLIGDIDLKYRKPIEIFENEYQFFRFKTDQLMNGVKIDQIAIYDLKYKDTDNLNNTTLCSIVHELKNWVIMNQLYSQCFDLNYKNGKLNHNLISMMTINKRNSTNRYQKYRINMR